MLLYVGGTLEMGGIVDKLKDLKLYVGGKCLLQICRRGRTDA